MATDKENSIPIEDEKKCKRLREEETKDVKDAKKVKTGEEEEDRKQNQEQEQEQEQSQEKKQNQDQDHGQNQEREKEVLVQEEKKDECRKEGHEKEDKKENNESKEVPSSSGDQGGRSAEKVIQEAKPKFVFGASSSFGSGFQITNNNDAASQKPKTESSKESGTPKPSAFGSGLSFGSGFGVLKKTEKKDSDNNGNSSESSFDIREKSKDSSSPGVSGIKLHKQEVKSGEEAEETLYQANAKLYQLADIKAGWKERGIGIIKVNKNKETGKARLVMRSRGMLKVILNLPLIKGFTVQKGFAGSMQSEKFIRMVTQTDSKAPIQTAVKTGGKEIAQELYDSMVKLIPK